MAKQMLQVAVGIIAFALVGVLILQITMGPMALPEGTEVEIFAGPHAGLAGRVSSSPWIGNFWHSTMVVNVPMGRDRAREVYGPTYGPDGIEKILDNIEHGAGPRDFVTVGHADVRIKGTGEDFGF